VNNEDKLSTDDIIRNLQNKNISIYLYDNLESTNDTAKKCLFDKTVILANEQTMGRGTRGKSFFSPPGSGIYMSVIFKHEFAENSIFITKKISDCVCRVIEKLTGLNVEIRGINDVFLNGKKICGVLTEYTNGFLIIGIGINVYPPYNNLPQSIADIAGWLFDKQGSVTRNKLIAEVINELEKIV